MLNGDVLSGHDLAAQVDLHRKADAAVTLHLVEVDDPARFGCVPTDADGRVTAFLEKTPNPVTNRINAGCYVFRREVIDQIPAGRRVSVERETFPGLIEAGRDRHGLPGVRLLARRRDPGGVRARARATWCSGDAARARRARPAGRALLLAGAEVAPGRVGVRRHHGRRGRVGRRGGASWPAACCSTTASVGAGAVVRDAIVGRGAVVGPGAVLNEAVIGDGACVGPGNELARGMRVWPGVRLGPTSIRFSTDV